MKKPAPAHIIKISLAITASAVVLLAGCTSKQDVFDEIATSRERSFNNWTTQQDSENEEMPFLDGSLKLEDAVKLALTYNKQLQAVAQQKEIARGTVVESYSEVLPSVSLTADYTRLDEVNSFIIDGQRVSLGFVDNYSVGLQVRQPLYRGGAISAALRAARVFALLSDQQVNAQFQRTIFETAINYYDSLLAQQLYLANRDAVQSAQAQLREVQSRRAQGLASEFDVLRAQVDVSNFTAEMIQQQNRVNLAKTRLLKTMGVSQESRITLADELQYSPFQMDMAQAVEVAFLNRPELYSAELSVRLQEESLTAARSRYHPRVDAFFNQTFARPDPQQSTRDQWGDTWRAGIALELPIFTGFSRTGQIIQQQARLRQSKFQLMDTEEQVLLEIQQALLSLADALELVESQQLNLQRANEGLRLAEVGYTRGVTTEVEVTDARAALTRARSLYYQAIYAHTTARLDLQRAMGVLGKPAEPLETTSGTDLSPELNYQENQTDSIDAG